MRRIRRLSSLVPVFVLFTLALAQAGAAAGHRGVLDRAHRRARIARAADGEDLSQLHAGLDVLSASVTLSEGDSTTSPTSASSTSDGILPSTLGSPQGSFQTSSLEISSSFATSVPSVISSSTVLDASTSSEAKLESSTTILEESASRFTVTVTTSEYIVSPDPSISSSDSTAAAFHTVSSMRSGTGDTLFSTSSPSVASSTSSRSALDTTSHDDATGATSTFSASSVDATTIRFATTIADGVVTTSTTTSYDNLSSTTEVPGEITTSSQGEATTSSSSVASGTYDPSMIPANPSPVNNGTPSGTSTALSTPAFQASSTTYPFATPSAPAITPSNSDTSLPVEGNPPNSFTFTPAASPTDTSSSPSVSPATTVVFTPAPDVPSGNSTQSILLSSDTTETSSTSGYEPAFATSSDSSATVSSTTSRATSSLSSMMTPSPSPTPLSTTSTTPPVNGNSSVPLSPGIMGTTTTTSSDTVVSQFSSISDSEESASLVTSTPSPVGPQVTTYAPSPASDSSANSDTTITSSEDEGYTPSQTWLIVATTSSSSVSSTSTPAPSSSSLGTRTSTTASLPSTAVIPSSIPTMIVPADSAINQPNAGTGSSDDPLKDDTLIAILLAAAQYPWAFVIDSSDATSQLFNTFPTLIANALNINASSVQTYGLMVYQPASWNGNEASLLTQWLAYIPSQYFSTLNAYLKTQSSPLYNQTGIQGQLAAQINTAYPLAASPTTAATQSPSDSAHSSSSRTRDIIIGVCVGIGGLLWLGLVFWIYKRVKRSNDRAVHRRLSEHMSTFSGHQGQDYGGTDEQNVIVIDRQRASLVPSVAGSDIDDRPSSFYASPVENDRPMREQQHGALVDEQHSDHGSGDNEMPTTNGPSVFGSSWFQQPQQRQMRQVRASQNPFEDIVTKSYLTTSGSAGGLGGMSQRRSPAGKPGQLQKGMISQPTLQTNSLEFREY